MELDSSFEAELTSDQVPLDLVERIVDHFVGIRADLFRVT
jgi:hypothetical protein